MVKFISEIDDMARRVTQDIANPAASCSDVTKRLENMTSMSTCTSPASPANHFHHLERRKGTTMLKDVDECATG